MADDKKARRAARLREVHGNVTKYQGTPCIRGHVGVRYVCNQQCVECHVDKAIARQRQYRLARRMALRAP